MEFYPLLECCETIVLSSTNPSFYDPIFFNAYGVGIYRKDAVDSRDRIVYRNSYEIGINFTLFGFGDFILKYEGPNEGGRENWIVSTLKFKYINMAFYFR